MILETAPLDVHGSVRTAPLVRDALGCLVALSGSSMGNLGGLLGDAAEAAGRRRGSVAVAVACCCGLGGAQLLVLVFELEDHADPGEVEAGVEEVADAA